MPVEIQIPAPLRSHTDGQDTVLAEGSDVQSALRDLGAKFPAITDRIFEPTGQVRRFVNIYVNDEDIRFLDQLTTALRPGDRVSIIPAVAGG